MLDCYATDIVSYKKAISETSLFMFSRFSEKAAVSSFGLNSKNEAMRSGIKEKKLK